MQNTQQDAKIMTDLHKVDFSKLTHANATDFGSYYGRKFELFLEDFSECSADIGITPELAQKYGWGVIFVQTADDFDVVESRRYVKQLFDDLPVREEYRKQFFDVCPERGIDNTCFYVYGKLNLVLNEIAKLSEIPVASFNSLFEALELEEMRANGARAYANMMKKATALALPVVAQG